MKIVKTIARLQEELDKLRPLNPHDEQRLWRKFRLEWDYNSNHLEGNTLTYGETELLLIFGKTTGAHDKREFDEMAAHDVAIKMVKEMAEDNERPLTESFIRNLNKIILVRPFWKEAITPDGQPTRRLIKIGEYKAHPNSVRLENGEIFHYASPEETPALMQDLVKWYDEEIKRENKHPLETAAAFHHRLVKIHPFDDGNGRVARLLMNYVLLRKGYPPVIIKSADKKNYLNALNRADTGDLQAFTDYIGKQLIWSLEKSIEAAQGKNIDEPEDVDKEISLIERRLKIVGKGIKKIKSKEAILDLFDNSLSKLLIQVLQCYEKFDRFYSESKLYLLLNGIEPKHEKENFIDDLRKKLIDCESIFSIIMMYRYSSFKGKGVGNFDYKNSIIINFEKNKYSITDENNTIFFSKLYHQYLSTEEINQITTEAAKRHTDFLNEQIEQVQKS